MCDHNIIICIYLMQLYRLNRKVPTYLHAKKRYIRTELRQVRAVRVTAPLIIHTSANLLPNLKYYPLVI